MPQFRFIQTKANGRAIASTGKCNKGSQRSQPQYNDPANQLKLNPSNKSPHSWVDVRDIKAKLNHTQNPVSPKLNHGSDRTSGASINTGTETRKIAAAKTNQARL